MSAEGFAGVVKHAGLTRVELANLYGVSRQTVHYWLTVGPPREGGYTARMAQVITAALLNAIDKKILPFAGVSREVRAARIERMRNQLQSLKPAPVK